MKKNILRLLVLTSVFCSGCTTPNFNNSTSEKDPSINSESINDSVIDSIDDSVIESADSTSTEPISGVSITPNNYWKVNLNERGETFRDTLCNQIKTFKTKTATYSACLSIGAKAAAYPNASSNTFVPFYHTTDKLVTTSSCNREHTWPNSRGGGSFETDPFMVRPTISSENSKRGNNFYGNEKSNEFDPASCGFEGARGEAARVILYCACRYAKDYGVKLTNNPSDATSAKSMGTLKTLLKWNAAYAPTAMEIQINNYLYQQGYGRNPFVDEPLYANYIWNESGYIANGGSVTSVDTTSTSVVETKANLVTDLSSINGKEVYLVSSLKDTAPYYAFTASNVSESLPWYFTAAAVTLSSDKSTMSTTASDITKFKVVKSGEQYKFQFVGGDYLYNYLSGTHYSISKTSDITHDDNKISDLWTLTASGKGFLFTSDLGVNLIYSEKGSFAGKNTATNAPFYLYA